MAISFMGVAQEKGPYISLSGGLGFTGFNYTLRGINSNGENQYLPGGHATLGFSYYFTEHWGVTAGVGMSHYRTYGKYPTELDADTYYSLGTYMDDDWLGLNEFELRARLGNWKEYQSSLFIEIPVMAAYQHRFGKKKQNGIYFGAGVKVQIPINSKYEVIDGEYEAEGKLNVSGFYGSQYPDFGNPDNQVSHPHGFGTIHNPNERYNWNSTLEIKPSIALAGELGFLIGLSRRADLMLGGYIDYGLNNIKKNSDPLMEGPEEYLPGAGDNIGEGITYNGMINSDRTKRVNLVSYGVKAGIRVRLGKVTDRYVEEEEGQIALEKQTEKLEGIEDALKRLVELMEDQGRNGRRGSDSTFLIINGFDMPIRYNNARSADPEEILESNDQRILDECIFFDLNSVELRAASRIVLDRKISVMNRYPTMKIRIVGNTCDLGNEGINIPLGLRRAEAAKRYLIERGIAESRIAVTTSSDYTPMLPNVNEENRALNRRADFETVHK